MAARAGARTATRTHCIRAAASLIGPVAADPDRLDTMRSRPPQDDRAVPAQALSHAPPRACAHPSTHTHSLHTIQPHPFRPPPTHTPTHNKHTHSITWAYGALRFILICTTHRTHRSRALTPLCFKLRPRHVRAPRSPRIRGPFYHGVGGARGQCPIGRGTYVSESRRGTDGRIADTGKRMEEARHSLAHKLA